jgi:hypothetical protein
MTGVVEPEIIINGVTMSFSQSMTIRVALESFASEMWQPGALGDDDHGVTMARLYGKSVDSIRPALYKNQPQR